MPSMTWLLESTSFSLGFLLRKMVGTGKQAGTALSLLLERRLRSPPPTAPVPGWKGGDSQKADSPLPPPPACLSWGLCLRISKLLPFSLGLGIFTE